MTMKHLVLIALVGALSAVIGGNAIASDKGPQRYSATLVNGAGTLTPVSADAIGRFTPQYLVFAASNTETQTVSAVVSGVTLTVGTKVISAGSAMLAITNLPTMFPGDYFSIASSTTNGITNVVHVIGTLDL